MLRFASRVLRAPKRPFRYVPLRQAQFHSSCRTLTNDPKPADPLDTIGAIYDALNPASPAPEASLENIARVQPSLSHIVRMELFETATVEVITQMWKEYHAQKYCISAVIDAKIYQRLRDTLEEYPIFLVPIPKESGSMFFVLNYAQDTFTFTSLYQYQLYQSQDDPANAPPSLTCKFYTELMDSKQVVLMRGQIDPVQIDVQEAQLLMNQAQLYYLNEDRLPLVQKFNLNPKEFDYNELLHFTLPNKIE